MATPCIVHGTITILRVTRGEVALAWNNNEPIFIDQVGNSTYLSAFRPRLGSRSRAHTFTSPPMSQPGLYEFDSADFRFVEYKAAGERLISLGAKKIIQVYTGEVKAKSLDFPLPVPRM